jgi:hypothetical protein
MVQAHTHGSEKLRVPGVIGLPTIHGYLNFHGNVMTDLSSNPATATFYTTGLNDRPATHG